MTESQLDDLTCLLLLFSNVAVENDYNELLEAANCLITPVYLCPSRLQSSSNLHEPSKCSAPSFLPIGNETHLED